MGQYIDKFAIEEEIKKLKEQLLRGACSSQINMETYCKEEAYNEVLSFLDTLEVKEEILDKEDKTKLMKKCVHKAYKRGYDMGVLKTTNEMNHNTKDVDLEKEIKDYSYALPHSKTDIPGGWKYSWSEEEVIKIASHFYELGLKTQKGNNLRN